MDAEQIVEAWSLVEGFAAYGFNRAHATAYSLFGYQMAYMKVHHTLEFHTALLETTAGTPKEKKYIKEDIQIKMLEVPEKPPMYLPEPDLLKLLRSDLVELHYRKAFYFYAVTGCRLEEPFNGEISGRWLVITSQVSKTNRQREVELDVNTSAILFEMRDRVESGIGKSGHGSKAATRRWLIKRYSREFKKCAIAEGLGKHHFHNLRDTYAVRRWAETGDIYLISKEIGHTSVKMTEKYADFNLRRLKDDFPSIADKIQLRLDKSSGNASIYQLGTNYLQLG